MRTDADPVAGLWRLCCRALPDSRVRGGTLFLATYVGGIALFAAAMSRLVEALAG